MKRNYFIIVILSVLLISCSKTQTTEQQSIDTMDSTDIYVSEPDFSSVNLVVEEIVGPVEPIFTPSSKETTSSSYSSSSSYNFYSDESGDYWEEKRKHSPNDNYLLGFDEDVDDVHDMELYMEDY